MTGKLVLNAASYGIEASKAEQLEKVFVPMVEKFKDLEAQYNEVLANREITKEVCTEAKSLRNKYVKVRTGADEIHKIAKASLLIQTRAIDGLRNIVKYAVIDHETSLLEIEKHFEKLKSERLDKIREERESLLSKFGDNPGVGDLSTMSEEVWAHYISSVEITYKASIEAEKKAVADRIEAEKKAIAEQKRIKAENDQLKKEAEKKIIEDQKAEKERQRLAKIEQLKQDQERKENEGKLQAERKKREKIEQELKLKQDQERKEKESLELIAKKEANEKRKLALEPEKTRLTKWVNEMEIAQLMGQENTKESQIIVNNIVSKFNSFKTWAKNEIELIK